ncbi:hypothetical protein ACFQ1S_24635 [Kibdelosporangium lantanae]|uniref:Uncharacterized protein n=1 Tax=Kibdelosporangium lantanae TaxID=1497396 RepID=A0ABW3MH42_9PSEU
MSLARREICAPVAWRSGWRRTFPTSASRPSPRMRLGHASYCDQLTFGVTADFGTADLVSAANRITPAPRVRHLAAVTSCARR